MSTPQYRFVFLNEEFTYLCYLMVLDESVTTDQIREWWLTADLKYADPLPGEIRRERILWAKHLSPDTGWRPTEEIWPRTGDVFHMYDVETNTYDPTEYQMVPGSTFIHIHMDDDSFLRVGGEITPHPNADPEEETEEVSDPAGALVTWGVTTTETPYFPTFNNTTDGS